MAKGTTELNSEGLSITTRAALKQLERDEGTAKVIETVLSGASTISPKDQEIYDRINKELAEQEARKRAQEATSTSKDKSLLRGILEDVLKPMMNPRR